MTFKTTTQIFTALIITVAITSCKTTTHTTVSGNVAGPTVIQKPVVADLEVGDHRVKGSASEKGSYTISEVKELAVHDAVTKVKADVLVEPRFDITKSFNRISVEVSGYPANYKNFRSMEAQDTIFIDREQLTTTPGKRKFGLKNKKGRKGKIIGFTAGGVAAAVGAFFLLFW